MLNLVLIRHGKSSWTNADLEDFDRPLNERGIQDLDLMARYLIENIPAPDIFLSSSAARAMETARGLASRINKDPGMVLAVDALYLAEPETIFSVLRAQGEGRTVYLCGHNPGISEFASRLCRCNPGSFSTLSILNLQVDGVDMTGCCAWEEYGWGDGNFISMKSPKDLVDG